MRRARTTRLGAVPYPNFGFIEWRDQNGKSDYKGIDTGLEKRFSKGYAFGVSYTLGDSKDNTSEQLTTQGSNAFPQNARDFSAWYGPSDYDVRHRVAANFVVNLPLGENVFARDWVVFGRLRVAIGPAVHRQPERQQRRHQHDRPAQSRRRSGRTEDRRSVVQPCRVPGGAVRRVRQRAAEIACEVRATRATT